MFLTPNPFSRSRNRAADYHHWVAQSADREHVRQDRNQSVSAAGPPSLWMALLFISAIVFAYMLFFPTPAKARKRIQAGLVAGRSLLALHV